MSVSDSEQKIRAQTIFKVKRWRLDESIPHAVGSKGVVEEGETCPRCGATVSIRDARCPVCGFCVGCD